MSPRPLPTSRRARRAATAAAIAAFVAFVAIGAAGCARSPVTTTSVADAPDAGPTGSPVTTMGGTTTTREPPTTEAPATTVADGPTGDTRVVNIDADAEVQLRVGEKLELVLADDPTGQSLWKADQKGTSVSPAGVRTEPAAEGADHGTIVTGYVAAEAGETVVTFSAALADGTPGDQFRVTITVT